MFFVKEGEPVTLVNIPGIPDFTVKATIVEIFWNHSIKFLRIVPENQLSSCFVLPTQIFPESEISFDLDGT